MESKLYGTSRVSYQKVGEARIMIKHTENINQESSAARTTKIGKIYIESPEGERFKYPYKHLSGARAMAQHVSEGGNAYDDFGKHIVGLSEELAKLRKFKTYMGRSSVMAESLAGYMDVVKERIVTVKKTIESLQKPAAYKEAFESFNPPVLEDVPSDVADNWIDQLTIKQFNEELKDVFPYIYKLVSEATKAKELGPEDIVDESGLQYYTGVKKHGKEYMKKAAQAGRDGASQEELGRLKDKYSKAEKKTKEEIELEQAFEDMMGQYSDDVCEECGNPSWRTLDEEKQKGVDGKVCWKGYKRMGTKMKGGKRVDNCVKIKDDIEIEGAMKDELIKAMEKIAADDSGELLYKALRGAMGPDVENYLQDMYADVAVDNGYHQDDDHDEIEQKMWDQIQADYGMGEAGKKDHDGDGDIDSDDYMKAKDIAIKKAMGKDDDDEKEVEEQKTPLGEFILSYFDRETGEFPKGETAVLTMVEKDYGEEFIEPAKAFIESINQTFESFQMRTQPQEMDPEFDRMRELAGLR
jgi:hypothetical protein